MMLLLTFGLQLSVAHCEEPIRIGAIFSTSGYGADGIAELNGALLAQEDINAAGGIGGRKLEILVEDNHSDSHTTSTAFHKLVAINKVPVVIGPNWASFTEIAAPLAEQRKVPLITPSGYRKGMIRTREYAFTLWPPHSVATKPLSDYIAQQKHRKIVALVSPNAYYEGILDAIKEQLGEKGILLDPILRFDAGSLDYRSTISKLKKTKDNEAILALLLDTGEFSSFLKQSKQQGLSLPIYSANIIPFSAAIQKNPSIAEGVIYFDYVIPGTDEFRNRFRARFKQEPNFASAQAYDSVYLVKKAIEKCGAKSEEILTCLKISNHRGVSGQIKFDEGGVIINAAQNTFLMQVQNGKFTKLDASR